MTRVCSVCFSPDARFLVSGSLDSTIRFWDLGLGKEVARIDPEDPENKVNGVLFSQDGRSLLEATGKAWQPVFRDHIDLLLESVEGLEERVARETGLRLEGTAVVPVPTDRFVRVEGK